MKNFSIAAIRIKDICNNRNIPITKLEREVGLPQGQISRWVKNKPSYDKIMPIAKYLNVSMDYICGLVGDSCPVRSDVDGMANMIKTARDKMSESERIRFDSIVVLLLEK